MNFFEKTSTSRFISFCASSFVLFVNHNQSAIGQSTFSTKECQNSSLSTLNLIDKAKKVTVRITSSQVSISTEDGLFVPKEGFVPTLASGVLVKANGIYYVITAQHFFEKDSENNPTPNPQDDAIEIPFQDAPPVPIKFETVGRSSKELDSIILKLNTQNPNWDAAEIQDAVVANGESLLVSGFPADKQEEFKCVEATLVNTTIPYLYYRPIGTSSKPERGMSGGSILNSEGKLIGIHKGTLDDKNPDKERGIPASVWLSIFRTQLGSTKNSTQTPSNNNSQSEVDGSKLPPVRALW